ncbi:MAG: ATP-binding protein [Ardenticatenaceae bacterium]
MNVSTTNPEAQWLAQHQLVSLLHHEQSFGVTLRLLLFATVLAIWLLGNSQLSASILLPLLAGLLVLSVIIWRVLQPVGRLQPTTARPWVGLGFANDILLVALALLTDPSSQSDWYFLFIPLAVKAAFVYDQWSGARFIPFSFPLVYAITLLLHSESWTVWAEPFFLRRTVFLLLIALLSLYTAHYLHQAREQARQRNLHLGQRQTDLDTRTQVLTQTATSLANRVLELRTLQEGMKAILASLDLNVLLELVVQNVSEVFGGASCVIGLRDSDGTLRVPAHSYKVDASLDSDEIESLKKLAKQVIYEGERVLQSNPLLEPSKLKSAMAVPMIVDGESIGALIATRLSTFSFTTDDLQRLSAFADQAALAVKNSRLYERVAQLFQEVKERSEELETVLNGIGDAVIVTGVDGHIRLANPVASLILGLPDELLANQPLPQTVLQGGFEEHLLSTLNNKSGDPVLGELTVSGGALLEIRTYQAHSAPLRGMDGQPRNVVTVLRDITAAKELELLKNNFVSTISHELKTPLHSIKGFVKIILSEKSTGPLNEIQRDFLNTVHGQTTRLERMILDLLEFSRLESGQIKLHPEFLNLKRVSEAMTEQLTPVANEAEVTLLCKIEENLPVEGDRFRIEQVFHNLMANAIKFTPPGGRVSVEGWMNSQMAEMVVRDTGIGIPKAEQERIFERFYQVDASQTRQYGGTGLGLAICKHIVERHGGHIWVESNEGGGSAFHFTLPRTLASATPLTVDFSRLETSSG